VPDGGHCVPCRLSLALTHTHMRTHTHSRTPSHVATSCRRVHTPIRVAITPCGVVDVSDHTLFALSLVGVWVSFLFVALPLFWVCYPPSSLYRHATDDPFGAGHLPPFGSPFRRLRGSGALGPPVSMGTEDQLVSTGTSCSPCFLKYLTSSLLPRWVKLKPFAGSPEASSSRNPFRRVRYCCSPRWV